MAQHSDSNQPTVSELRREREREEMTVRIMDVARDMFVREGYEAVTLRKIALAIEYSPAAIYQYFKDKQALVKAIMRRDSDDLRQHVLDCLELEEPLERIVEMARRYAAWGIAHPNHYRLMLVPPPSWTADSERTPDEAEPPLEHEVLAVLNLAVTDAIRRGMMREKFKEPSAVAATLWAGIHGLVLLEITMTAKERKLIGKADLSFEERFETLKEVLLEGLLKPEAR